jgi:hypothetical protein
MRLATTPGRSRLTPSCCYLWRRRTCTTQPGHSPKPRTVNASSSRREPRTPPSLVPVEPLGVSTTALAATWSALAGDGAGEDGTSGVLKRCGCEAHPHAHAHTTQKTTVKCGDQPCACGGATRPQHSARSTQHAARSQASRTRQGGGQ